MSQASLAADGETYASALLGYGIPTGLTSITGGFAFGADVGFKVAPEWTLGLSYQHTLAGVDTAAGAATGLDVNLGQLMGQANYIMNGFRIGPHLGLIFESILGFSETEFGLGAQVGYDFDLSPTFSTGLEFNFTHVLGSPSSYSILNFLVPFRFWF